MNDMITWPGGEWKTVRRIGQGGFGSVYEIQRKEFGKVYRAAMKVMRIPQNNAEAEKLIYEGMSREEVAQYYTDYVKRLSEEFALLSTLKGYTNIVSYEDHKIIRNPDGISWTILIRMELLTPVNQYIIKHGLNEEAVIKLGSDICRALEICHERNIIHRDIKLDNIFVNERGDFELGDFGIARITDNTVSAMTTTGTPGYMAPEVFRKEPYGQNADIYSLGIAMYMLLNKKRGPFYPIDRRITPEDREKALNDRMSGMKIPEPMYGSRRLKEAVLKAIACKPEDRYQTAEEFRKAFTEEEKISPLEIQYRQAIRMAGLAETWIDYEKTGAVFNILRDYKDSRVQADTCRKEAERLKAEENRRKEAERAKEAERPDLREASYQQALELEERAVTWNEYVSVEALLGLLGNYKDCQERAARCRSIADRLKEEERKAGPAEESYRQALQPAEGSRNRNGDSKKEAVIKKVGDYKDRRTVASRGNSGTERLKVKVTAKKPAGRTAKTNKPDSREASYQHALKMESYAENPNDYERATVAFNILGDYKDCRERAVRCGSEAERLKRRSRRIKAWIVGGVIGSILLAAAAVMYVVYGNYGLETAEIESKAEPTEVPVIETDPVHEIAKAKIGETVTFGKYEQDNRTSNGKEDIKWIVLDKEEDKALLISKNVLDVVVYNEEREDVTWETCTLRSWLNDTFMDEAFEDAKIDVLRTHLQNEENTKYDTSGGKDTYDKLFCLSITEAQQYFKSDTARMGSPTEYAKAQDLYVNRDTGASWWWLRTPGHYHDMASGVSYNGSVGSNGNPVNYGRGGVRPALWVSLES